MADFRKTSKVVQLSDLRTTLPTDLISLRELSEKYNFTYSYLYKVTVRTNELPYYNRGVIMVSERVFINWVNGALTEAKEN